VSDQDLIPSPVSRQLRIFAFDPSISAQLDTAGIGEITIAVPWEKDLEPGPVGEYIEVIDADPASGVFYLPVDLNDPRLLAQNGLPPSETNPQFHQQMVYAVAMATIVHFEQALGRVALWSSRLDPDTGYPTAPASEFVRRLRIYPHALRDRNAYYSPAKKALLFGYFPSTARDAQNTPGTLVHTCLSHDIVAHETAHALLEGVHPRFSENVNADVLAFHEAFADIVALFQHFAYPGVLRDQIARTRGDLTSDHLLGKLALQFGMASGRGNALRDYLGTWDVSREKWTPHKPNVRALDEAHAPHARGAVLVAAVFGAFLKVYRSRTADLFRIATDGTGVLRKGEIHPDLAGRLAAEAATIARYTLQMCIRAIDYCPPVGITFGDYLRAVVTADHDLNPDDVFGYRVAFTESFRQWGIYPKEIGSLSVESLLWPTGWQAWQDADRADKVPDPGWMMDLFVKERSVDSDAEGNTLRGSKDGKMFQFKPWGLESDRLAAWDGIRANGGVLWSWLVKGLGVNWAKAIGIVIDDTDLPKTVIRTRSNPNKATVEVHSVRTAVRRSPRGGTVTDLVVEIMQRRAGYFDEERQQRLDRDGPPLQSGFEHVRPNDAPDFTYRAGCTLLIDPVAKELRRVIRTAGPVHDKDQLDRVRHFIVNGGIEPPNAFDGIRKVFRDSEPFALLHHRDEE